MKQHHWSLKVILTLLMTAIAGSIISGIVAYVWQNPTTANVFKAFAITALVSAAIGAVVWGAIHMWQGETPEPVVEDDKKNQPPATDPGKTGPDTTVAVNPDTVKTDDKKKDTKTPAQSFKDFGAKIKWWHWVLFAVLLIVLVFGSIMLGVNNVGTYNPGTVTTTDSTKTTIKGDTTTKTRSTTVKSVKTDTASAVKQDDGFNMSFVDYLGWRSTLPTPLPDSVPTPEKKDGNKKATPKTPDAAAKKKDEVALKKSATPEDVSLEKAKASDEEDLRIVESNNKASQAYWASRQSGNTSPATISNTSGTIDVSKRRPAKSIRFGDLK